MSSLSRQRSVNVMQIVNSQMNNAFNVLKNRLNSKIRLELTLTQTTCDAQSQLIFKLRDRSKNDQKTTKNSQNEEL